MDLIKDNLTVAETGIPGGATVDSLASAAKNAFKGIRDKAKRRQAQKASDAGGYWTLRPYLKSLIKIPQYILDQVGGQGITETAVLELPAQGSGATNESVIRDLKSLSGLGGKATIGTGGVITGTSASEAKTLSSDTVSQVKKYAPYIIGAIVIGLIIYFIVKKK